MFILPIIQFFLQRPIACYLTPSSSPFSVNNEMRENIFSQSSFYFCLSRYKNFSNINFADGKQINAFIGVLLPYRT